MKKKITFLLLTLISVQLTLSAQTINLAFQNEALPTVLKKLEQASSYRILFTYDDVQSYQVTATLHDSTIFQAIEKVLEGKPLTYTQKDNQYIIILSTKVKQKPLAIQGTVMNEKNEPMPFCNVLLLAPDSTFVNGCVTKEDGSFAMVGVEGTPYLLKTSYIGYITSTQPADGRNLIQLLPDAQMLAEVTVTAERPLIEPSANGLKANVIGTSLAKMGTAGEMLSHLPFVTGKDGSYTVLGHGTPEIYINNRKVRDTSELDRLRADEIVSAEVITTPGVEYASDVTAVIRIRTIKQRGQGWSGSFHTNYSQGSLARGNGRVNLNYRTGGLDIFGSGYIKRNTNYGNSTTDNKLEASSIWETYTQAHYNQYQDYFYGTLGFNYDFNERHSIGLRYEPNTPIGNHKRYAHSNVLVKRDGEFLEEIQTEKMNMNKGRWKHSVNGYYSGNIGQWQVDVNADYLFGQSESLQQVINNGEETAKSTNKIRNYLYAVKAVASTPLAQGRLSFGTEETFTNRHDLFFQSGFSTNADNHVKQGIWSVFANYSRPLGKWKLNAGFRYEHQQTDYYEEGIYKPEQSPNNKDFIPTFSVNYANDDWNLTLSYKPSISHPHYSTLSNSIQYLSKYEYAVGNPLLESPRSKTLSLDVSWKWIYFTAFYMSTQKQYTQLRKAYNDETHPGVTLFYYKNIPQTYTYNALVTLAPKFGIWQPQFTFNISYWDAHWKSLGIEQSWKGPYTYFILDNTFNLPKGWLINLQGTYIPKFKQGSSKKTELSTVDFRLSKSFLKDDALNVTLTIDDIFHQQHDTMTSYFIGTSTTVTQYFDHQRVGVTLSYKFNATKSKYKGTGAGQSEKSRL
ncbi:MAG: outer membrane beta-barrel protein [Bacteroidaceae bacterium]|nr:outer membrane beta-barrel protein [Bacteroidaceae bacterium]